MHRIAAPFACDFECDESCGEGGMEVSGFVAFAEGAIDNSTIFGDWGDFPADGQTLLEIPVDQLTEGSSLADFKLDVLEFLKEGKIAGDDGDCDHVHGKGTKGKKGKKCKKSKSKKGKKSKKNKGDKTPKAAKKKGGKKGKLNQLAAKMAVKRTSQVAVALLGSMLMVAAVAGYMYSKKKKTLSEGETQMLLPAANSDDVAFNLHWIYETAPLKLLASYTMLRSGQDGAHAHHHRHNRTVSFRTSCFCFVAFVAIEVCGGGAAAAELQPLPPSTGMSLVVEVAGTTKANDAFWKEKCKKIPSNTECVVVDMGAVRIEI